MGFFVEFFFVTNILIFSHKTFKNCSPKFQNWMIVIFLARRNQKKIFTRNSITEIQKFQKFKNFKRSKISKVQKFQKFKNFKSSKISIVQKFQNFKNFKTSKISKLQKFQKLKNSKAKQFKKCFKSSKIFRPKFHGILTSAEFRSSNYRN